MKLLQVFALAYSSFDRGLLERIALTSAMRGPQLLNLIHLHMVFHTLWHPCQTTVPDCQAQDTDSPSTFATLTKV